MKSSQKVVRRGCDSEIFREPFIKNEINSANILFRKYLT